MILRTFCVAGLVAGFAMLVFAAVTRDVNVLLRAVVPLGVGGYARFLERRNRPAAPLFAVALVLLIASVSSQQTVSSLNNGALGIVAIGVAASLMLSERRVVFVMSMASLGIITAVRAVSIDEPVRELVFFGFIPLIIILFGSNLMHWMKLEVARRDTRFSTLLNFAPVAMWEEDFSKVALWLDDLRRQGVTDIRAFLADRPDLIRHGASLIEVLDVNAETLRFLEAPSRESLLGPLKSDLIVEDTFEALIEEIAAVWEDRPNLRVDLTGRTTQGEPIDGFLLLAAPQLNGETDWSRVVIAIVDASEQRATNRRLAELVDSKDQFVASVSHELRTPLTAVIGLAEELRLGNGAIEDDERAELLDMIADQATEVGNIVEDLLVAAQANIGRVTIQPQRLDIGDEIRSLLNSLDLVGSPRVDIGSDVTALADPRRLRQILRNLITNAYRYGGDVVTVEANVIGSLVTVAVTDDGDGIPDSLQERIFEPYETAHRAKGVTGSVGLGLTVSRELAGLMGGSLSYHRDEGTTVFRLTLPAADEAGRTRLVS